MDRQYKATVSSHWRASALVLLAIAFNGVSSGPLSAQPATGVRFVQWPIFDAIGGGLRVDATGDPGTESPAGTIWATTRQTDPRLIRLLPGSSLESDPAVWTAWSLASGEQNAEGIAIAPNDQVFVRTTIGLQRLDPYTNRRTVWADGFSKSDVALGPGMGVWSALPLGPVQRLTPDGPASGEATVTRWLVGGSGEISLAGVAVHPTSGLVYFSDNGGDAIGELDPTTNQVRRWSVGIIGAFRPRNVSIDRAGDVWAVSRSNHIIRLRPPTNELTAFLIPSANSAPYGPYGIVADGVIGFTESGPAKIGLLIPTGSPTVSLPTVGTVAPTSFRLVGEIDNVLPVSGTAAPIVTDVQATAAGSEAAGYFIEAAIPSSFGPMGIDRHPADPPGTFYYVDYGNRLIGRASLPLPEEALVTGGGWIAVPGGRASFSFTAFRKEPGGPVEGNVRVSNHATGETLRSVEITDLFVYGTDAALTGTMTFGELTGTFTLEVSDRGEPGTSDNFRMAAEPGATIANSLGGGNIQIHRKN
jgi:DNA-binding beta-propeller fold protein YncE